MKIFALVIPTLFVLSFLVAARKKVRIYDAFTEGIKNAVPLILSVFPYIAGVLMLSEIFYASGLEEKTIRLVAPLFRFVGVPEELAELVFIKPLSGAGATAVLSSVVETHGVDSYIARCACVLYGSADTVFYIGAVYFAGRKEKRLTTALILSLVSYFAAVPVGCLLCRFL